MSNSNISDEIRVHLLNAGSTGFIRIVYSTGRMEEGTLSITDFLARKLIPIKRQ